MLKFPKKNPFGKRNNIFSEYIGSHIFNLIGVEAQETILGIYKGEYVVACKDFIYSNNMFVPYNDVSESSIEADKESFQYSYDDIIKQLEFNKKIVNLDAVISTFFEIYIIDAFLGNFDRHGSNWGFLKKDNKYFLAPVFDNGSSLFPNLIDDNQIEAILNSEEEMNNRIYQFPTSQILLGNKKSSYFSVISSLKYDEINKALVKIYPKIDLLKIDNLIDEIPIISDVLKKFYKKMLEERYYKIIKFSYDKLRKGKL